MGYEVILIANRFATMFICSTDYYDCSTYPTIFLQAFTKKETKILHLGPHSAVHSSGGSRISRWGGAPTSNAYTFRQKHMRKRKKLILFGARAGGAPWIRQCIQIVLSKVEWDSVQ